MAAKDVVALRLKPATRDSFGRIAGALGIPTTVLMRRVLERYIVQVEALTSEDEPCE